MEIVENNPVLLSNYYFFLKILEFYMILLIIHPNFSIDHKMIDF